MSDQTTQRLVTFWGHTQNAIKEAETALVELRTQSAMADYALGDWLAPKDMAVGEKVGIWMAGRLLQVELLDRDRFNVPTYFIKWRQIKRRHPNEPDPQNVHNQCSHRSGNLFSCTNHLSIGGSAKWKHRNLTRPHRQQYE